MFFTINPLFSPSSCPPYSLLPEHLLKGTLPIMPVYHVPNIKKAPKLWKFFRDILRLSYTGHICLLGELSYVLGCNSAKAVESLHFQ